MTRSRLRTLRVPGDSIAALHGGGWIVLPAAKADRHDTAGAASRRSERRRAFESSPSTPRPGRQGGARRMDRTYPG
jgi:hypothetical protein